MAEVYSPGKMNVIAITLLCPEGMSNDDLVGLDFNDFEEQIVAKLPMRAIMLTYSVQPATLTIGDLAPVVPTLAERFARFYAAAKAGTIFVNEYGRRCELIGIATGPKWRTIEQGPWYTVRVFWEDAEPSETVDPWWSIGEPEVKP